MYVFGSNRNAFRLSCEWILWTVCLLVIVTIRGIPNPVRSLLSIEVTNRGREGRARIDKR